MNKFAYDGEKPEWLSSLFFETNNFNLFITRCREGAVKALAAAQISAQVHLNSAVDASQDHTLEMPCELPQFSIAVLSAEPENYDSLSRIFAKYDVPVLHYRTIESFPTGHESLQSDVLLVDMADQDVTFVTLSALHQIARRARVVLWVHSISTELALQAMSLGVRGILRKTLPVAMMLRCVVRVKEGELWFEKSLTESIMSARRYSLTRREGQLVTLLSQGLKNKEIATALNISEGTVKVYLSRLFQKLGVRDRFELALYGLKNLHSGSCDPQKRSHDSIMELPPLSQPPRALFMPRVMSKVADDQITIFDLIKNTLAFRDK